MAKPFIIITLIPMNRGKEFCLDRERGPLYIGGIEKMGTPNGV
jgi:hypothetical protein